MAKYLFWGEEVVDLSKTTAQKILHRPKQKEKIMSLDKRWEGDDCNFLTLVKTPNDYRIYYNARAFHALDNFAPGIKVAVLISEDGLVWKRASINKYPIEGNYENNIIKDSIEFAIDNFIVFYDENPDCPAEEKYKALAMVQEPLGTMHLYCYISEDGFDFKRGWSLFGPQPFTDKYRDDILIFDSANVAFWDNDKQKYVVFFRGMHDIPNEGEPGNDIARNLGVRDIRYAESKDFKTWSTPVRLSYDKPDYPLYTNCVSKYDSNVYIGFPTRYNEYKEWNDSFDEMLGSEHRKAIIDKFKVPRYGLALTDCLFMYSYDGKYWHRFDEAYYTPGQEEDCFWMYGSCYPCIGYINNSSLTGECNRISLFCAVQAVTDIKCEVYRYEVRKDGFIGFYGDYEGKTLTTKPFTIDGESLSINFATSAAGCVQITLTDESGVTITSQKHLGDSVKRKIKFDKEISVLKGRVTMTVELKDAHIYSFEIE